MSERTDPRTAKQSFALIASAGTLASLASAFASASVASWFGVGAMLPLLAALNLASAGYVRHLAHVPELPRVVTDEGRAAEAGSPGVLSAQDAVTLAGVILLGTLGSTIAEHLMNVQVHDSLTPESLPRFFSAYYAGVSLLVFIVQAVFASRAFSRFGLGVAMSSPFLALGAGGLGALMSPGIAAVTAVYGSMSVLYESLFRPAKDVFFTSVPAKEQRRIKLLFDLAPNRVGSAVGAGLIALAMMWWAERFYTVLLLAAMVCSGAAAVLAARLTAAYVGNLGRSLILRGNDLDLSDIDVSTMRTALIRRVTRQYGAHAAPTMVGPEAAPVADAAVIDPEMRRIQALRSGDRDTIRAVLTDPDGVRTLIQQVIPLLASDPVAQDAVQALRGVAEECVGALIDALLDANQPVTVRRRLARVLSACTSQRAVDGLLGGLDDMRFEVRLECGRSLSSILQRNATIEIDGERVLVAVRREIAVGRPVWNSHRRLEDTSSEGGGLADEFVKDRSSQSLAHVFTLLSVVLPSVPMEIASRALHGTDQILRGLALEYLQGVLPADIYDDMAPFIGAVPAARASSRSREEILADLLRSNSNISASLEELRRWTNQT